MQSNESTAKAMSGIRKDAHYSDLDVVIRGDDNTFERQSATLEHTHELADHVDHGLSTASTLTELAGVAGHEAPALVSVAALPIVGSVVALYAGLKMLCSENEKGQIRNETAVKEQMHVAMLSALDLPNDFKTREMAKFTVAGQSFQGGAQRMTSALAGEAGKPTVAVLQLHADQGMDAARRLLDTYAHGAPHDLSSQPGLHDRLRTDPAFKAGFDVVLWARNQPTNDAYKTLIQGLDARDVRYEQHHIAYRA